MEEQLQKFCSAPAAQGRVSLMQIEIVKVSCWTLIRFCITCMNRNVQQQISACLCGDVQSCIPHVNVIYVVPISFKFLF